PRTRTARRSPISPDTRSTGARSRTSTRTRSRSTTRPCSRTCSRTSSRRRTTSSRRRSTRKDRKASPPRWPASRSPDREHKARGREPSAARVRGLGSVRARASARQLALEVELVVIVDLDPLAARSSADQHAHARGVDAQHVGEQGLHGAVIGTVLAARDDPDLQHAILPSDQLVTRGHRADEYRNAHRWPARQSLYQRPVLSIFE